MHRVSFHIHRHYLTEFIRSGDRVLEAGAASGRFTVELARLGARIVVTDISPGQLELNVANVGEAGLESAVEARELADIVDLHVYAGRIVRRGRLLRRTAQPRDGPRGRGTRRAAPGHQARRLRAARRDVATRCAPRVPPRCRRRDRGVRHRRDAGDLRDRRPSDQPFQLGTPVHLFSWAELGALLDRHACDVVVASAANFLSVGNDEVCERWRQDPEMWERFLAVGGRQLRTAGSDRRRDTHPRRRPRALITPLPTCGFHPFRDPWLASRAREEALRRRSRP